MCTQRTWTVADWQTYLMGHPLMKFLCQRLVWAVCDEERVEYTFRPLDDGTLTDCDDNEVQLGAGVKRHGDGGSARRPAVGMLQ
jgi:hypothetical protein